MEYEAVAPTAGLGFAPTASSHDLIERLQRAKRQRQPFSFIRLGSCEGNILAYPAVARFAAMSHSCKIALGRTLAPDELEQVQRGMRRAIAEADVLGVHAGDEVDRNTIARATLDGLWADGPGPMLCRAYANLHLAKSGFFSALLQGESRLGLVSCNDLSAALVERLGVGTIDFYPVPSEAKRPTGLLNPAGQMWSWTAHYPDLFNRWRDELRVSEPGQIFLVGAGFLGKIYCGWIRERGGIALDMGSVLDGWAGLMTRKYLLADTNGYLLKPVG